MLVQWLKQLQQLTDFTETDETGNMLISKFIFLYFVHYITTKAFWAQKFFTQNNWYKYDLVWCFGFNSKANFDNDPSVPKNVNQKLSKPSIGKCSMIHLGSISPTFYVWVFRTKSNFAAFL